MATIFPSEATKELCGKEELEPLLLFIGQVSEMEEPFLMGIILFLIRKIRQSIMRLNYGKTSLNKKLSFYINSHKLLNESLHCHCTF